MEDLVSDGQNTFINKSLPHRHNEVVTI